MPSNVNRCGLTPYDISPAAVHRYNIDKVYSYLSPFNHAHRSVEISLVSQSAMAKKPQKAAAKGAARPKAAAATKKAAAAKKAAKKISREKQKT